MSVGLKQKVLTGVAMLFLSACNPLYVGRAAYEQARILWRRQPIQDLIDNPSTAQAEREKLQLVLAARAFGVTLGLDPGSGFTTYAPIDGEAVSWLVAASRKDAFALYQWWFPIVGRVPYKGYFDKEDAQSLAHDLEQDGYETWVRGAEAFSSLGWFNDPLLSTTLRNPPPYLVNTVLHESLHSTLWIPDQVNFNESLAHFVGTWGTIDFFASQQKECADAAAACALQVELNLNAARRIAERELLLSATVQEVYAHLEHLYQSEQSTEEKLQQRVPLFQGSVAPFREQFPEASVLKEVNNAEILLIRLYLTKLERFLSVFQEEEHSWPRFLARMRAIMKHCKEDSRCDPYALL